MYNKQDGVCILQREVGLTGAGLGECLPSADSKSCQEQLTRETASRKSSNTEYPGPGRNGKQQLGC